MKSYFAKKVTLQNFNPIKPYSESLQFGVKLMNIDLERTSQILQK